MYKHIRYLKACIKCLKTVKPINCFSILEIETSCKFRRLINKCITFRIHLNACKVGIKYYLYMNMQYKWE